MIDSLLLYRLEPSSPYAEAIRGLRAIIMKHTRNGRKVLIVTSSWPDEGKSTSCLNLACALAELGNRVLLIDGDLRRASLSELFRENGEGIAEGGRVVATPVSNLSIAPAGRLKGSAIDILVHPRLRAWMETQRTQHDAVLIDTPPLSACSDAKLWGTLADGAILICSSRHFRGLQEGHYCEDLREEGIEVLGVVVTG